MAGSKTPLAHPDWVGTITWLIVIGPELPLPEAADSPLRSLAIAAHRSPRQKAHGSSPGKKAASGKVRGNAKRRPQKN